MTIYMLHTMTVGSLVLRGSVRNPSGNICSATHVFAYAIMQGIKGLTKLITDLAPGAIKEQELKNYLGRKVAIDASMAIYQFLVNIFACMYVKTCSNLYSDDYIL